MSFKINPKTGTLKATTGNLDYYEVGNAQANEPEPPDPDKLDLSLALDKSNNLPLFTEVSNPGLRDVNQAVVPSDAPVAIPWSSATAAAFPLIIDTTGYQSVAVHKLTAGIITPTVSNDRTNWYGTMGYLSSTPYAPAATMPTALGIYIFPVTARFFRLTGPASLVQCVIYLRQIPSTQTVVNNLAYLAGTAVVTGGLAGVMSIGGNVATGVAPTTNPIQLGGVDAGRLNTPGAVAANLTPKIRRLLVDELGRLIPPQVESSTGLNFQNTASAYTKDVSQYEGLSLIEILYQVLVELKTLNYQIHELPITLNANMAGSSDDLDKLRAEMLMFKLDS